MVLVATATIRVVAREGQIYERLGGLPWGRNFFEETVAEVSDRTGGVRSRGEERAERAHET
jgi:hypothetical protein